MEANMSEAKNEGTNLQLFLKRIPQGVAGPDDFEVRETEIPQIGDQQVLVQAHYLSVDAALRLIVRDSDEFLFRIRPGDMINNTFAGQVIESNNADFHAGDYV